MTNWCSTGITFYSKNKEELLKLKRKLNKIYNGKPTAENDSGPGWLGDYANTFYPKIGHKKIDCRGILIPVRDIQGRIQGLQIRRDNVKKRKFRWFSSTDRRDGCRAESWTHLAGNVRGKILLTEGPMKADVIHALTSITVLAVPGVNALAQLQKALEQMRAKGLREIKTAFDMDMRTNPHVQEAYQKLLELLKNMGFRYGTYLWDENYKGLDDYLWATIKNNK